MLLAGNPALPAQDLAALIALAKAKPNTLSIAIGGIGSSLHLAGEQLKLPSFYVGLLTHAVVSHSRPPPSRSSDGFMIPTTPSSCPPMGS